MKMKVGMRRQPWWWLILVLVLVGCGASSSAASGSDRPPAEVNTPTEIERDFEIRVYIGSRGLGGDRVMFSDLFAEGKPVVLEMWAGQCPSCRRVLPEMQAVYERYEDEVVLVGLDIGAYTGLGDEDDARLLYQELDLSFPAGTLSDPSMMSTYRVTGIPMVLYFEPNGALFHRSGGVVGTDVLGEEFAALIAAPE